MDREQLAGVCVRIEKAGGNVLEYLREKGCISPWGTWYRMQIEQLGRKGCEITDGKGRDDMRKMTLEMKKKAVEIAISGGDPLKYLEGCGSKNPSAHWYYIKKALKEKDPDQYAQIPGAAEKKEEQEARATAQAEDTGIPDRPVDPRQAQAVALDDDFEVYGLKTKDGDYFLGVDGKLSWTYEGHQMTLPVECWRKLVETVPKVLNVMKL